MSPEQPSGVYQGKGGFDDRGRRWYDPNRIAIAAGVLLIAFVTWWGTLVYSMASNATQKNIEQDVMLKFVVEKVTEVGLKVDRISERMPK
jgi:hypothetical protein